jgi:hypothetical protein
MQVVAPYPVLIKGQEVHAKMGYKSDMWLLPRRSCAFVDLPNKAPSSGELVYDSSLWYCLFRHISPTY